MTLSTRSLILSSALHAGLVLALASIDVAEPARLRVAGGEGSGEDGPVVRIRIAPAVPPEPGTEPTAPPVIAHRPPVVPPQPEADRAARATMRGDATPATDPLLRPATARGEDLVAGPPLPPPEALSADAPEVGEDAPEETREESPDGEPARERVAESAEATPPARPEEEAAETAVEDGGGAGVEAPRIEDPDALRPRYPLRCRRLGHEGVARIAIEIGPDGRVREASVARSAGCADLDRAALDAVRGARFYPARELGRAVPARVEQEFRFRLGE